MKKKIRIYLIITSLLSFFAIFINPKAYAQTENLQKKNSLNSFQEQTNQAVKVQSLNSPKSKFGNKDEYNKNQPIKNSPQNKNLIPKQTHANSRENGDEDNGLFGPVRVGPMAGIGFPMGPNMSIEAKIFKYLGLSFTYGHFNNFNILSVYDFRSSLNSNGKDYIIDSARLSINQIEGKISYFPWGETFFIGAAAGQRNITVNIGGTITANIPQNTTPVSAPVNIELTINSVYITPQIGWLASWDGSYGGFAIGTEFGAQISVSNSSVINPSISAVDPSYANAILNSNEYLTLKTQTQDQTVNKVNQYPIPYWNIIKVGWLF